MITTLGLPPVSGADRERWARQAERLANYRHNIGITDPAVGIGARPE